MDVAMDGKFHIHGNPVNVYATHVALRGFLAVAYIVCNCTYNFDYIKLQTA